MLSGTTIFERAAAVLSRPRRAPLISLCVVLGCVTSTLIAWNVERSGRFSGAWILSHSPTPPHWSAHILRDDSFMRWDEFGVTSWIATYLHGSEINRPVPSYPVPESLLRTMKGMSHRHPFSMPLVNFAPYAIFPSKSTIRIEEVGFPFRCFSGWSLDGEFAHAEGKPRHSYLELPGFSTHPSIIAYRLEVTPLWWGLIANTVFWAGVWYGLILLPGAARRRYIAWIENDRAAKGLCRSCRYNLAGVEVDRCPECGRGVPAKG
jgi:hypothetical protein